MKEFMLDNFYILSNRIDVGSQEKEFEIDLKFPDHGIFCFETFWVLQFFCFLLQCV